MLAERLSKAWRARQAMVPVQSAMAFGPEGLVLGARTVLASADADRFRPGIRLVGQEARMIALLSAALLRPVSPQALNHIRKAAEHWSEGRSALAEIHLALSGVSKLDDGAGAQRLFLADGLLEEGVEPEAILRALGLGPGLLASLAKDYHTQPRVPKGSGRPSGQWTVEGGGDGATSSSQRPASIPSAEIPRAKPVVADANHALSATDAGKSATVDADSIPGDTPAAADFGVPATATTAAALPGSAEWLTLLSRARLIALAVAIAPAAIGGVGLNLILVPNKSLRNEGVIPGQPPIHYLWHSDQRSLTLSSTTPDGVSHTAIGELGADDIFRDERGRAIGRLLPNGTVLVLLGALISVKAAEKAEPDFCPAPGEDKPGRNVAIDRDFEDYVKEFINPGNPTPRGYGYQLPNPKNGDVLVFLDDCQHSTGDMIEIKRGYETITTDDNLPGKIKDNNDKNWLAQSLRQLNATTGRHLVWVFSNQLAADHARNLFLSAKGGRENIEIRVMPWYPGKTWF